MTLSRLESLSWRPWTSTSMRAIYTLRRPVRVSVPKETADGERRVALVPEVVARLKPRGIEVAIERGAGEAALLPDSVFEEAGATVVSGDEAWAGDVVVKVGGADLRGDRPAQARRRLHRLSRAAHVTGDDQGARLRGRQGLRDGVDPADHARPVDGRPLVSGHGRRLPRGADRRGEPDALLPDAHHRRRHREAREGARAGRRRRRPSGDRDLAPARRPGARLRRARRREGAGRVAGREVPRARPRGGRRGRGRLREGAGRGAAAAPAGRAGRGRRRASTPRSPPR